MVRATGTTFPRRGRERPRAASRRSRSAAQFGESWWAKRWIAVLESFNIGGAADARPVVCAERPGAVDRRSSTGEVTAKVQGSRPKPYDVTIQVKTLPDTDWAQGGRTPCPGRPVRGQAAGRRDAAGHREGLRGGRTCRCFPRKLGDLKTDCSCPDWSNPCKHIAAVYYLLGEEFDRDPFLLFRCAAWAARPCASA